MMDNVQLTEQVVSELNRLARERPQSALRFLDALERLADFKNGTERMLLARGQGIAVYLLSERGWNVVYTMPQNDPHTIVVISLYEYDDTASDLETVLSRLPTDAMKPPEMQNS